MNMKTSKWLILISILLITWSMAGCTLSQGNMINGKIAFLSNRAGNLEIYTINTDGKNQTDLTQSPADDVSPAWSPDGEYIAFESDKGQGYQIYVMKADGSGVTRVTGGPGENLSPEWSPDGKSIAFLSYRDNVQEDLRNSGVLIPKAEVYIMAADGSDVHRITNDLNFYYSLSWSPNSRSIALCAYPYTGTSYPFDQIFILTLSTAKVEMLTRDPYNNCNPTWSPDGKHILFTSNRDDFDNIYIMNADGTNQVALIKDSSYYNIDPSWSPDGKQIVFSSQRDGNYYHLYIMNEDGTHITQLTNGQGSESNPVWSSAP